VVLSSVANPWEVQKDKGASKKGQKRTHAKKGIKIYFSRSKTTFLHHLEQIKRKVLNSPIKSFEYFTFSSWKMTFFQICHEFSQKLFFLN